MKKNDLEIGQMVAIARQERSLSQDQLADRMRALGHNWTRQTVWGVEKGTRGIRLSEAYDLEDILGISFFDKANYGDRSRAKWLKDKRENEVKNAVDRIRSAYEEAYALGQALNLAAFRMGDEANGELAGYLSGLGEGLAQLYYGAPAFLREKKSGEEFIRRMRESGTPFTQEDVEAIKGEIGKRWHAPLGVEDGEPGGKDSPTDMEEDGSED